MAEADGSVSYRKEPKRTEDDIMEISYRKLWYRLIERKMKKRTLMEKAGISQHQVSRMAHNMDVSTKVLRAVCVALDCDIGDIIEVVRPEKNYCDGD